MDSNWSTVGNAFTNTENLKLKRGPVDDFLMISKQGISTRTLTGTGKLEGGAILAKVSTELTGMTGALGNVVTGSPAITGSPALNLSNATFPAGHFPTIHLQQNLKND